MSTQWTLRLMKEEELDALYRDHIETSFPSNERPNLPAMHRHIRENLKQIWIMTDGREDVAYAVVAEGNGVACVTLLAVFADKRGGGKGTALLALLRQQYADRRAIVLEVEDPADDPADEARPKRIRFYERNGFHILEGVRHMAFGVPLLLMALPLSDTPAHIRATAVEDMRTIYHRIMPERLWSRVETQEEA